MYVLQSQRVLLLPTPPHPSLGAIYKNKHYFQVTSYSQNLQQAGFGPGAIVVGPMGFRRHGFLLWALTAV